MKKDAVERIISKSTAGCIKTPVGKAISWLKDEKENYVEVVVSNIL